MIEQTSVSRVESPDDMILYDLLAIGRILLYADIEGAHESSIEKELSEWFGTYKPMRLAVTIGNLAQPDVQHVYAYLDATVRSGHVVDSFDPYAALEDVSVFLRSLLQQKQEAHGDLGTHTLIATHTYSES